MASEDERISLYALCPIHDEPYREEIGCQGCEEERASESCEDDGCDFCDGRYHATCEACGMDLCRHCWGAILDDLEANRSMCRGCLDAEDREEQRIARTFAGRLRSAGWWLRRVATEAVRRMRHERAPF